MFPIALVTGFGRFEGLFSFIAQVLAIVPDLPGSYVRVAFYRMTLRSCAREFVMGTGAYFAHPQISVGDGVGIAQSCIIGYATIGDGAMLGPHVQVLSGGEQHKRDSQGRLTDEGRKYTPVSIGEHCFIGANSVILADVGAKSTVAAGSVVFTPVPAGVTVGGNPAERWWPPKSNAPAAKQQRAHRDAAE